MRSTSFHAFDADVNDFCMNLFINDALEPSGEIRAGSVFLEHLVEFVVDEGRQETRWVRRSRVAA
jgi:hypothetical protein